MFRYASEQPTTIAVDVESFCELRSHSRKGVWGKRLGEGQCQCFLATLKNVTQKHVHEQANLVEIETEKRCISQILFFLWNK